MRFLYPVTLVLLIRVGSLCAESVSILLATNATPRVEFGAHRLQDALKNVGLQTSIERGEVKQLSNSCILAGTIEEAPIKQLKLNPDKRALPHEGFLLATCSDGVIAVAG